MNRYILIPEDTIRVLPPEDGAEAAVEIFCSRPVIYFEIAQILDVCLMHNVLPKCGRADALCFTAAGAKRLCALLKARGIWNRMDVSFGSNGPGRFRGVSGRTPDICAENAGFFQRGRLYPGVLRPQRPSSRIKTKKAAHPERKRGGAA